jgi:hypothetical protein
MFGASGTGYAGGLRLADRGVIEVAAELFASPEGQGQRSARSEDCASLSGDDLAL